MLGAARCIDREALAKMIEAVRTGRIAAARQHQRVDQPIAVSQAGLIAVVRVRPAPLMPRITNAEREAHLAFVGTLGDKAIWNEYFAA